MKAIVKATSNGNKIDEYVNSYKHMEEHAPSVNTKEMRRQLIRACRWLKSIEAKIRQTNPEYQIRWSTVSAEIWLHYIYHLEKQADRHAERIAKMYEAMDTLVDYYDFLNYEYGNMKLLNTPAKALYIFKGEKAKTA